MADARAADGAEALLLVGRVLRAHGVRGELKVVPETDDPARFEVLETCYLGPAPAAARSYTLEGVRLQQTKRGVLVLCKLEGVDTREDADALRRQQVYAAETDLPPLEEDEAFLHDLVGLAVETEAGAPVGTVERVMQAPAHAVYVVARDGAPPALIPAVEAFIVAVDLEDRRLVIRPIEGLL